MLSIIDLIKGNGCINTPFCYIHILFVLIGDYLSQNVGWTLLENVGSNVTYSHCKELFAGDMLKSFRKIAIGGKRIIAGEGLLL